MSDSDAEFSGNQPRLGGRQSDFSAGITQATKVVAKGKSNAAGCRPSRSRKRYSIARLDGSVTWLLPWLLFWSLAVVLFLFVPAAFAQTPSFLDRFDRIYQNRDGTLTPDELSQPQLFRRMDLDGAGVIGRT